MAGQQHKPVVYTGIRGRDGSTAAQIAIPPHKAFDCLNVDFYRAELGRRRGGAADVFALTTSEDTASVVSALARHVPGADETAAELWQVTGAATPIVQRLAGGTVWASITVADAIATRPQDAWPVSFNGKLFWFYDSTQDRGHVYDPVTSTTALRRTGLATPSAAPTVADTGSGSYAATPRWYRVREVIISGSTTILLSEASTAVSFTPIGTGTHAVVTKPADMSQGATHWRLEASATSSSGPFYILATTVVGTTTYSDLTVPSAYSAGTATEVAGEYVVPGSFKYAIADGARLLMAGAWESTVDPSSVYFTPVLGSSAAGYYDDERLPVGNKIPLDPKDGGVITGFGGPFESQVIAFKQRQVWRIRPTGNEADPYRRFPISKVVGCIRQQSVVMAEDETGNATLYWLSHLGPYRYNLQRGLSKLVWDVKDIWDTVNLSATTVTCHGVYHSDIHQIWWWVATGSNNEPDTKLVFDTRYGRMMEAGDVRDGWTRHNGPSASARCSVMFSNTLGSTMTRDLKPYIGQHAGNGRLWKCDTADLTDVGTLFQSYVLFPFRHFGGMDKACVLKTPTVLGSAGAYNIGVAMFSNYDFSASRSDAVSMAAVGSATRVLRQAEGAEVGDLAFAVAVYVGDESAVSGSAAQWTLDAIIVPVEAREELVVT